jgi:hypothetical protein
MSEDAGELGVLRKSAGACKETERKSIDAAWILASDEIPKKYRGIQTIYTHMDGRTSTT